MQKLLRSQVMFVLHAGNSSISNETVITSRVKDNPSSNPIKPSLHWM